MSKYNPQKIEKKWQKKWEEKKFYFAKDKIKGKKNYYLLTMFPYPSGDLHVGHWLPYTGTDIYGRFKRMQGFNVMSPIGFDAFGLPAENAAINRNLDPKIWTYNNIKTMKKQLNQIGTILDWSREIITAEPNYYKWTQWIFLKLFEAGLAKKEKILANWCPHCKTILANEQVQDGKCERCDTVVEQKLLDQWVFKITDYAQKLLDDLDKIDWPETTKVLQKKWIGRSEGTVIKFQVENSKDFIEVFTTRPDTLFGATFMVLAPEHELIKKITKDEHLGQVNNYLEQTKKKTELERLAEISEKTGVFTGAHAFNPATKEKIPIWISDFVLPHYGTGAIMAVPAHDQRDLEFAKKFNLPIKNVIEPVYIQTTEPGKMVLNLPFDERNAIIAIVKHWSEEKYIGLKWKEVTWGTFITGGIEKGQTAEEAAKMEIKEETGYLNPELIKDFGIIHGKFYHVPKKLNRFAHAHTLYFELQNDEQENTSETEQQIHDIHWLTNTELEKFLTPATHQHALRLLMDKQGAYMGEGILVNSGEFNGMDSEKAKWETTKFVGGERKTTYRLHDWIISRQRYWGAPIPIIYCQKCGWQSVPEKDLPVLLPKTKDYKPLGTGESPLAKSKEFVKTKCPKCFGEAKRETDTMDTFVDSAWYFLRYADPKNKKEFASKEKLKAWLPVNMYIGGQEHATKHLLYARFITKVLYDLGHLSFDEPFTKMRHQGLIFGSDGNKMSKSRGNVVDPDEMVKKFGSDSVRMYLCFMGPYENGGPWNPKAIVGVYRFLHRISDYFYSRDTFFTKYPDAVVAPQRQEELRRLLNRTIKEVEGDIQKFKFNTAISKLMVLFNTLDETILGAPGSNIGYLDKKETESVVKLLAPFVPHLAEELWHFLGNKKSIHLEGWPKYDPELIKEEMVDLIVQINGKTREIIKAPHDLNESQARDLALASEKIKKYISGKEIKRFIYISNKLVNIVI